MLSGGSSLSMQLRGKLVTSPADVTSELLCWLVSDNAFRLGANWKLSEGMETADRHESWVMFWVVKSCIWLWIAGSTARGPWCRLSGRQVVNVWRVHCVCAVAGGVEMVQRPYCGAILVNCHQRSNMLAFYYAAEQCGKMSFVGEDRMLQFSRFVAYHPINDCHFDPHIPGLLRFLFRRTLLDRNP